MSSSARVLMLRFSLVSLTVSVSPEFQVPSATSSSVESKLSTITCWLSSAYAMVKVSPSLASSWTLISESSSLFELSNTPVFDPVSSITTVFASFQS